VTQNAVFVARTKAKYLAEFLGTAALLATVVGSGIMGVQLAQGNMAIALLANAAATAGMLYVLITTLGPISGAHFNPLVSLVTRWQGELSNRALFGYICAQVIGAILGVLLAHAMFDLPIWQPGTRSRTGAALWLSEAVATSGLLLTIFLGIRFRSNAVPALVPCYVFAAYWFTASTAFANPAVTIARALTQSFSGIQPSDVFGFLVAQCLGALVSIAVLSALALPKAKIKLQALELD
jgi:glycerol uptake facilitator-like aquaporin